MHPPQDRRRPGDLSSPDDGDPIPPYGGVPLSIQRLSRSTCSSGHAPSHGIDPDSTAPRIGIEFAATSSNYQRSKALSIAVRSDSLNSGLMSLAKLGVLAVISLSSCMDWFARSYYAAGAGSGEAGRSVTAASSADSS